MNRIEPPSLRGANTLAVVAIAGALLCPTLSAKKFRDDIATEDLLAVKIQFSAKQRGKSNANKKNYEKYARRLARTLAMLSEVQQDRVFR